MQITSARRGGALAKRAGENPPPEPPPRRTRGEREARRVHAKNQYRTPAAQREVVSPNYESHLCNEWAGRPGWGCPRRDAPGGGEGMFPTNLGMAVTMPPLFCPQGLPINPRTQPLTP